jgi:3-hydroxyisobutyrate dehydrogenase-like beta-hydroxyacid dehydrogenase
MLTRMLAAGSEIAAYNRTRQKVEPFAELGATIVDRPLELSGCEMVFTMVAGPADFEAVVLGPEGLMSGPEPAVRTIVDFSTVSPSGSAEVREQLAERGVQLLAAPVSGNPKVVTAGKLTLVASGPAPAFEEARPHLETLGEHVTYVGEGETARVAKICHNLMLGVVAQCLAEITVLAEKSGMSRADFLEFLNRSVMGSTFTQYKTPALVHLDFKPTFTPSLLRKDFDLGFELAHELNVPMPVAAAAAQVVQAAIGSGYLEEDFAVLLQLCAEQSGLKLETEEAAVGDGLQLDGQAVPAR